MIVVSHSLCFYYYFPPRPKNSSDQTGRAIMENLLAAVASNSNIDLRCNTTAIDLIKSKQPSSTKNLLNGSERCDGAFVLSNGCVELIEASNVILATGGCGDLYSNTSNPQSARGDGVAMALRAGAKVVSRYNTYLVVWIL
jgi:L-aspartate oxidase